MPRSEQHRSQATSVSLDAHLNGTQRMQGRTTQISSWMRISMHTHRHTSRRTWMKVLLLILDIFAHCRHTEPMSPGLQCADSSVFASSPGVLLAAALSSPAAPCFLEVASEELVEASPEIALATV